MELLVCVLNDETHLNTLLEGFVNLGITGATVVPSQGMGRRLGGALPATGALQAMLSAARPENTTVFSVIDSAEKLDAAVALAQRVCGDLSVAGTGIVFTVPVDRVVGLAPPLDSADADSSGDTGGE